MPGMPTAVPGVVCVPTAVRGMSGIGVTALAMTAIASGMASRSLTRITFDGKGGATVRERWSVPFGVRDIAIAPDGAIWLSEGGLNNSNKGALYRVTPK